MTKDNLEIFLQAYSQGENPPQIQNKEEKPRGYWKDIRNVNAVIEKFIEKVGTFPTTKELYDIHPSLPSAIQQYHGSVTMLREKMGYDPLRRADGYWTLKNTLEECGKLIEVHGELPSQNKLKKLELTSLSAAIQKYGGFHAIRKKLKIKGKEKFPKGYWNDESNAIKEYKILVFS